MRLIPQLLRVLMPAMAMVAGMAFADTQTEINYLLEFVANTDCQFERNGTMHTGEEARDHIQVKYDYYRGRIKSTEDFIRYSATKSKFSGKTYRIHCPGSDPIKTSDWLMTKLTEFRKNGR